MGSLGRRYGGLSANDWERGGPNDVCQEGYCCRATGLGSAIFRF